MRKIYATMLLSLLWSIFTIDESCAHNAAFSPVQQSQVVALFYHMFTDGLLHSEVLGDFANFQLYQRYDLFNITGISLLARAGIDDLDLVKVVTDAAMEVGLVTSKPYFDTTGSAVAKFMFERGLLTIDNVDYLALRFVTSIELVACKRGLIDTLSVFIAVVFGLYNVLESFGLINYDNLVEFFYLFAEELKEFHGLHD